MEKVKIGAVGFIEVYRVRDSVRTLVFEKKQTITTTLFTNLCSKLSDRDTASGRGISVDGITWGSMDGRSGTFVDGTYVGTFSSGTGGGLVRSNPTTSSVKFSGTFAFDSTKYINYFELGQGFQAAASGISQLTVTRYAYDNSLLTGSTSLSYLNGESLIINWTLSFQTA